LHLTLQQKIKLACDKTGISMAEIGRQMGISQPSISNRVKTGKFTQEEMEFIAKELGAEWHSGFNFPDGTKIE
jgi:lambda repressor-like predicted transcriptional regulator